MEIWTVCSLDTLVASTRQVKGRCQSAFQVFTPKIFERIRSPSPPTPSRPALTIWLKQIYSNWQSLSSVQQAVTCCASSENPAHLSGLWDDEHPTLILTVAPKRQTRRAAALKCNWWILRQINDPPLTSSLSPHLPSPACHLQSCSLIKRCWEEKVTTWATLALKKRPGGWPLSRRLQAC